MNWLAWITFANAAVLAFNVGLFYGNMVIARSLKARYQKGVGQ